MDTRSRFRSRSWGQFPALASHLAILVVMMRHNHILRDQNNIREGLSVLAPVRFWRRILAPVKAWASLSRLGKA